jgi:nucleoside-diphosphate-sugar epimerase
MAILITGANGFIGRSLYSRLASGNKVIGVDITGPANGAFNIAWEQADLTDQDSVSVICEKNSPDVVIHCAGIAHQKIGVVDSATYMRVNSEVTENLAQAAAKYKPNVSFIFFSSVSVYGEHPQITQITQNKKYVSRKDAPVRSSGLVPVFSRGPTGQAQITRIRKKGEVDLKIEGKLYLVRNVSYEEYQPGNF